MYQCGRQERGEKERGERGKGGDAEWVGGLRLAESIWQCLFLVGMMIVSAYLGVGAEAIRRGVDELLYDVFHGHSRFGRVGCVEVGSLVG